MKSLALLAFILFFQSVTFAQTVTEIPERIIAGMGANGYTVQGNLVDSESSFDIAISGDGWLPIQSKKGEVLYTRYGKLGMNDEGLLIHLPSQLPLLVSVDKKLQTVYLPSYTKRKEFFNQPGRKATPTAFAFNEDGVFETFYSDGSVDKGFSLALAAVENQRSRETYSRSKRLIKFKSQISYFTFQDGPHGKFYNRKLEAEPEERYK